MKRLAISFGLLLLMVACGGETTPNQAPIAAFTLSQTGLSVSVDAATSSDSDGAISTYSWDFGDTSQAVLGVKATHTYDRAGEFVIKLSVTDNAGSSASSTKTVTLVDPNASISGSISLGSTTFGAQGITLSPKEQLPFEVTETTSLAPQANRPQLIAGEVLVRFKDETGIQTQALNTLRVQDKQFSRVRSLGLSNTVLYRTQNINETETLDLVSAFKARADVLDASANYWHYPSSIPNDPGYAFQWHYPAINMPQAWDLTKGSDTIVVAVLDTGVLPHPELADAMLPGYDFVSDLANAADSDGRDADPTDTGPEQATGYHGTHVAGTIGAKTNDGAGVASVAWNVKILPVRVLGVQGGSTADINDGVLWAAGLLDIDGVANPHPADVLNLSLGGTGTCEAITQAVYDDVIAAGKIIVIAAGNGNENAGFITPANCDDVITVGATDFASNRAFYSNFGNKVNVMAPGGDTTVNLNADKYFDGVLSLGFDEAKDKFTSTFNQGTSMATPHVAGVAALMKSLKVDVTQAEVLAALSSTARPLSASSCTADTQANLKASDCGAGLIDAFAALQAIDSSTPPPPPLSEGLSFSPSSLDFGTSLNIQSVTLKNEGTKAISWQITSFVQDVNNPVEITQILVDKATGTLTPQAEETVEIDVNRGQTATNGTYRLNLVFEVDGKEEGYPISFTKGISSTPSTTGNLESMKVYVCTPDQDQAACLTETNSSVVTGSGLSVTYSSKVAKDQTYTVTAWKDNDSSGAVNTGDFYGYYSVDSLGATELKPPQVNIDFTVEEVEDSP